MAKRIEDVISASSTEADVRGISSTPVQAEPGEGPAPEGKKEVPSPEGEADRPVENRLKELERRLEDSQRRVQEADQERQRLYGALYDMSARAQAPPRAEPEGPSPQEAMIQQQLGQYGLEGPPLDALRELIRMEVSGSLSSFQDRMGRSQTVDDNNERMVDFMLGQEANRDMAPYRQEILGLLRAQPVEYKSSQYAVPMALNQCRGGHYAELREKAVAEARRQAGREREIIGQGITGTTVNVNGQEVDMEPAERRIIQNACDAYNKRLSESDLQDPKRVMTVEKWVQAHKRVQASALDTSRKR